MKDMFYNYDNNIDKKNYPIIHYPQDDSKILESNPTLSLVVDVKGNEIGVCARHTIPFELFFMMDGCVENSSIEELVMSCTSVCFRVVDYWHKIVLEKVFLPDECYIGDDTIKIALNQSDVDNFKQETYNMNLTLYWPGGSYTLYSEDNGFLTIK